MKPEDSRPLVAMAKYLAPKQAPDTVYHYTSLAGALGILSSRTIFATDIQYVNDLSEYAYALDAVVDYLVDFNQQAGQDEELAEYAIALEESLRIQPDRAVYVASFSHDSNSLSQWRAYADGGSGLSLGFDSKSLISATVELAFFAECVYDLKKQKAIISELGREVLAFYRQMRSDGVDADQARLQAATEFHTVLGIIAPILKHPAFVEEREWRLVVPPSAADQRDARFRVGKSQLIPYIELPLAAAGAPVRLNLIVVGPTPHPDTAKAAVNRLCEAKGIEVERIAASPIPYRNW